MTPYEYFIEEGYPSEIAEELSKFLEGNDEYTRVATSHKN